MNDIPLIKNDGDKDYMVDYFIIPALQTLLSKYQEDNHLKYDSSHETLKEFQNRKAHLDKK
jgi:hypothetical protein